MMTEIKTKGEPEATQNSNAPKKLKLKIKTSMQAPTEEPAAPCKTGHIV